MRFSFHQVITILAIGSGFALMYNGTAGTEVFLYLCGVAILATVLIPNRRVEIVAKLRGFQIRLRSLPDPESPRPPALDDPTLSDAASDMDPDKDRLDSK